MKSFQTKLNRACIVVMLSFFLTVVIGQGIDFHHDSWAEVKEMALKEDKVIFVDAYTTWCGPCKWMSANVFTDKEVADYYNDNFVNFKLDMEKGEGVQFASDYNVRAYPTLLYIDGHGELVHQTLGSMPPAQFITVGEAANDPNRSIGGLMKRYEGGERNSEFLQNYLEGMMAANMPVGDAAQEYLDGLSKDQLMSKEAYAIMMRSIDGMQHPFFETVTSNLSQYASIVGKDQVHSQVQSIAKRDLSAAFRFKEAKMYDDAVNSIGTLPAEIRDEVLSWGKMIKSGLDKDIPAYMANLKSYTKEYKWDDWAELNSLAWAVYEDENVTEMADVKIAQKIAKRSVKLESNFYNNDTYAALLYRGGKYKKALKVANEAVRIAKATDEDPSETERMILVIKEMMK